MIFLGKGAGSGRSMPHKKHHLQNTSIAAKFPTYLDPSGEVLNILPYQKYHLIQYILNTLHSKLLSVKSQSELQSRSVTDRWRNQASEVLQLFQGPKKGQWHSQKQNPSLPNCYLVLFHSINASNTSPHHLQRA